MNIQPEALRLADILQHKIPSIECLEKAAAELRRLHEVNQVLVESAEKALGALEAKGDSWVTLERKAKEALRQALTKAREKNT